MYQKLDDKKKKYLKTIFEKEERNNDDLKFVLDLIKKNNIINDCYIKAEYFIGPPFKLIFNPRTSIKLSKFTANSSIFFVLLCSDVSP